MPPPTDREKAERELLKYREEIYSKPFLETLQIPRPPSYPFSGHKIGSCSISARKEEKRALSLKEKQEKAAEIIWKKSQDSKKPPTAFSQFFSARYATPKSRSPSFGSTSSSP